MKARLLWWQFDHSRMETAKAINWSAQSTSSGWKPAVQLTWFPAVTSTTLKPTASSFPPERHEAASECGVQEVDGHGLNSTFSRILIMPGQKPLCVRRHHTAVRNDRGNTCARHAMGRGEGEEGWGGGVSVSDHHAADYLRRVEERERNKVPVDCAGAWWESESRGEQISCGLHCC